MVAKVELAGFALQRLCGIGGARFVVRLVDLFLETVPRRLEIAEFGERSGDLVAVARAVHSLRSSFQIVGADDLAMLAGRIEERAREGDRRLAGSLLGELKVGVQRALKQLDEERKKLEG